jgi:hypothetical protein
MVVTAHAAVDCSQGCLIGKYYRSTQFNTDFQWVKEAQINYNWGEGSPRVAADNFGIIWSGSLDTSQIKTIVADCDDAARLTINGKVVLSSFEDPADWNTGAQLFQHLDNFPMWATGSWGGKVPFQLEYREFYGEAKCRLMYSATAWTAEQFVTKYQAGTLNINTDFIVIPQSFYSPPANPTNGTQLEEYTNATLESTFNNTWQSVATIVDLEMKAAYFAEGYASPTDWIIPCAKFSFIGTKVDNNVVASGNNVILRITMGQYVDFYRPTPGNTLCTMLQSSSSHQWAPAEAGPWYNVSFSRNGYGGSEDNWLTSVTFADWRRFPSFWFFNSNNRVAGCCYGDTSPMPEQDWRKDYWERWSGKNAQPYKLDVRYTTRKDIDPATQKPSLTLPEPSGTIRKWDVYAQVNADIKINYNRSYQRGWRLNYINNNLHPVFIQKCSNYDSMGDAVVMRYRFGVNKWINQTTPVQWMGGSVNNNPGFEAWFRPRVNSTFCDMINTHNLHEWSDDGISWYQPTYHTGLCGGSSWDWPRQIAPKNSNAREMNVYHLPFWCGDRAGYGKYDQADGAAGQGRWGRGFQLLVRGAAGERWAGWGNNGTLKANNFMTSILALGGESFQLNITGLKQEWNNQFVDQHMIPNENTTALKPKIGDVLTAAQVGNCSFPAAVTQTTWQVYRTLQLPQYFGISGNENNYWVRYYSICIKPTTASVKISLYWDEQMILWNNGVQFLRKNGWSDNREWALDMPVTAGAWTQLVVKHVDLEWGSGFGIRFPDADVEWSLQC